MKASLGLLVVLLLVTGGGIACGGSNKNAESPPASDTMVDESAWLPGDDAGLLEPSPAANTGTTSSPAADPPAPAPQGTEESARALLAQFTKDGADHAALTKSLRPTSADYKALFDATSAGKVEATLSKDWDKGKVVIDPKPKQTDLKIWAATSEELAAGKGNAKEFSGGYRKIARRLAPGITIYRFKFAEPGKARSAKSFDGLAFVNGRWVVVPRPWIALK